MSAFFVSTFSRFPGACSEGALRHRCRELLGCGSAPWLHNSWFHWLYQLYLMVYISWFVFGSMCHFWCSCLLWLFVCLVDWFCLSLLFHESPPSVGHWLKGFSYLQSRQNGSLVWEFKTGARIRSSPTVADNIIFFGSDDGKVYALNARGKLNDSMTCAVIRGSSKFGKGSSFSHRHRSIALLIV